MTTEIGREGDSEEILTTEIDMLSNRHMYVQ